MNKAPKGKTVGSIPLEKYRNILCHDALPVHVRMFEKHRLVYMRGLCKNLVIAELRHHCQVIEELTPLLALLSDSESISEEIHFSS